MGKHNCKEILSKVFQALDGEMSRDEELLFLEELNSCSHCFESFELEKMFKAFLVNKINKSDCSDKLVDNIRKKIQSIHIGDGE